MTDDCIFCAIVDGRIPATKIDEDDRVVAFMDINPATRGHALVIPKTHAANVLEIDGDDLAAVAGMARAVAQRAVDRLGADGVNLLNSCGEQAWQTVFHMHMHVIPRYAGDPLQLPWIPAPGDAEDIAAAGAVLRSDA